jgi:hypothetical protein
MNTSQRKTNTSPKRDDYLIRSQSVAILIGLGLLGYYSYCFGFWGRNSLFLQYLFQCNCPGFGEDWRHPGEVDVIVSACHYDDVTLSPSGRTLYVQSSGNNLLASDYALNLQTHKKTRLPQAKGSNYLLTDELIFHSYAVNDEYILDVTTGIKHPIQNARKAQPGIFPPGTIEPTLLLGALSQVDQIYIIDGSSEPLVALSSDFRSHPENGFFFNIFDFPEDDTDSFEKLLQQNNITYHDVPGNLLFEVPSPDARFIARSDGIYLARTSQLIVEVESSRLKGWIYDGRGAIYTSRECLFLLSLPGLDMSCLAVVPQPAILLKVPEEYLTSAPTR